MRIPEFPDQEIEIDPSVFDKLPDLTSLLYGDPIRAASTHASTPAITAVNRTKAPEIGVAIRAKGAVVIDGPLIVDGTVTALQVGGQVGVELDGLHAEIASLRAELDAVKRFLRDTSGLYHAHTSGYFA